ncbi:hypothetical protein KIN20_037011 [Parelaphostrongylus tenuis]|uniref:Uncharacterized protein n=1 Tax=Parelaphostrongylus tenuis TaxID=148309 RepID=A0AAD5RDZ2_PARTN|nr:hypothetical protein KIN20_037011 [Parelaphostrongylus tenuis]
MDELLVPARVTRRSTGRQVIEVSIVGIRISSIIEESELAAERSADDNECGFTGWASCTSPYLKQTITMNDSCAREKRMETMLEPTLAVKTACPSNQVLPADSQVSCPTSQSLGPCGFVTASMPSSVCDDRQDHLAAVFRSFKDSCLASERVLDNSAKLIELDARRQKIREALRLLRRPQQESTTWLALTESLMMEFTQSDTAKILQRSLEKTEDDYTLVNKQVRDELNNALKAESAKDLKSRGFDLKPINK